MNLVLYLVEKYYDRETAIYCSKVFQIDISRHSQSSFTIFKNQKNHNDELIKRAQLLMYLSGYSEMKIFREAFKKATDITQLEYKRRFGIGLKWDE